jgi:hypothetical protein
VSLDFVQNETFQELYLFLSSGERLRRCYQLLYTVIVNRVDCASSNPLSRIHMSRCRSYIGRGTVFPKRVLLLGMRIYEQSPEAK